jgi:ribosome biogenesis protein UTP30
MVDETTINNAITALLTLKQKQESDQPASKRKLFSEEDIFLVFALNVPSDKWSSKPRSIALPHPLYNNASACLIVKDPQSPWKKKITDKEYPIEKVISLSKLKKNYAAYEAKRKLCQSYDLFLVDEHTHHRSSLCFGSEFFSRKKYPIPVHLSEPDNVTENLKSIQSALSNTYYSRNKGPTTAIKIAKTDFTQDQIRENLKAVLEHLEKKTGFDQLRSVHIKTKKAMALPLWKSTLPESSTEITVKKVKKPRNAKTTDDSAKKTTEGSAKKTTEGATKEAKKPTKEQPKTTDGSAKKTPESSAKEAKKEQPKTTDSSAKKTKKATKEQPKNTQSAAKEVKKPTNEQPKKQTAGTKRKPDVKIANKTKKQKKE